MKMKLHLIYIALPILLASCENEIPYNSGNQEPQLIMNALLDAGSTENQVYLHLGEGNSIERLNEATLTLFVNNQIAETPQAMTPEEIIGKPEDYPEGSIPAYESIRYKLFRLTTPLHPGDNIRLEATAENGKYHASAEVIVPQPIESLHVDTCLAYLREYNGQTLYRQYKITLQDRPGEKNYYRLDIQNRLNYRCEYREYLKDENGDLIPTEDGWGWLYIKKDTLINYNSTGLINREDVILTDGHPGGYDDEENELFPTIDNKYNIFTDSRFSNSSTTLKVYTPHFISYYPMTDNFHYPSKIDYDQIYYKQTIIVRLLTLPEAEYRYLKALNCLDDGDYDEALMEPISLPCNVEGGLGFVGVATEKKIIIELPETQRYQN